MDFGFPLGHPFGFPDQRFLRRQLIKILLEKLGEIDEPGTIVKIPVYEGERGECEVCGDVD